MKKKIFLLLILFLPKLIFADGIDNYYINATLLENGNLEVEEYFNLTGEYNGMERIIEYKNINAYDFYPDDSSYGGSKLHNGNGLIIKEIMAVNVDDNFNFDSLDGDKFRKVSSANRGDYAVYTSNVTSAGNTLRMYMPSYKNKAFYLKYEIENIAILHNDVGEIGWNAIGKELSEDINHLEVTINIPNNKNTIKVWAHGPLTGESEIIDQNTVKASIDYLPSYTAIDVRVVFDKEVISKSNKKSNVSALDKIIKYETDEAEKANHEREMEERRVINDIEEEFSVLDVYTSRSCYDHLLYLINSLVSIDKREPLLKRLITYQDRVDTFEYQSFKNELEDVLNDQSYYDYSSYKNAESIIDNIFSKELKDKMKKELSEVKQEIIKIERNSEIILSIIAIVSILITVGTYYIYDYIQKKRKTKVDPMYIREIPSNLYPECVGLITDSKITGNEVSAALLDLIHRKIVTFQKLDNGSYDLTYNKNAEGKTEFDDKFAKLIFGSKTTINSKKIKKIKYDDFFKWKKQTIRTLEDNGLINKYDTNQDTINGNWLSFGLVFLFTPLFFISPIFFLVHMIKKYKLVVFIRLLMYVNLLMITFSLFANRFNHISVIFSIIAIIVVIRITRKFPVKVKLKKTEKGKEEANKWQGLRNFLIDFSRIQDKEIPEVSLWEEYLIYATAFGIGKEVLKAMKIKIESANIDTSTFDNYVMFSHIDDIARITSSVKTVSASTLPLTSSKTYIPGSSYSGGGYSSGSYSSGSGSGGGFSGGSSGGGSFGGGGGGGRF